MDVPLPMTPKGESVENGGVQAAATNNCHGHKNAPHNKTGSNASSPT